MSASFVRVLIATTTGPVEVQRLEHISNLGRSLICLNLGIEQIHSGVVSGYNSFIARGSGVIEQLFGKSGFRMDVSGPIEAGVSWQLGVFLSHALFAAGRLAMRQRPNDVGSDSQSEVTPELIVWATGEVRPLDLSVGAVGHIADKLQVSMERLKAEATDRKRVIVVWPKANAVDASPVIRRELSRAGIEIVEAEQVEDVLSAIGLPPPAHAASAETKVWKGSPFRGLEQFEAEHRKIFFGRGRAREEALDRLRTAAKRDCAFLLIYGPSGVGKSSLVRAGLLGDLMLSATEADAWRTTTLSPSRSGSTPLISLADALCAAVPELDLRLETLAQMILEDPEGSAERIKSAVDKAGGEKRLKLTLFIDQLEELFFWAREHGEQGARVRDAFAAHAAALAGTRSVWVISTIRSDLIDLVGESAPLLRLAVDDRRYLLKPPIRAELRDMLLSPAKLAGLKFEGVDKEGTAFAEILEDAAAKQPDSLPLLQFVLSRLYEDEGRTGGLSFTAYEQLGGLEGAIGRWADRCVAKFVDTESRRNLDNLLLELGHIDEGDGKIVARIARLAELDTTKEALIEAFTRARLLVRDNPNGIRTVRIAHEAVLTHWAYATGLFARHAQALALRDELEMKSSAWEKRGHDPADLLSSGSPLEAALSLLAQDLVQLSPTAARFINASREKAIRERSARQRRLKAKRAAKQRRLRFERYTLLSGVAGLLVACTIILRFWHQATTERDVARASEVKVLVANAKDAIAERRLDEAADGAAKALSLNAVLPDEKKNANVRDIAINVLSTPWTHTTIDASELNGAQHVVVSPDGSFVAIQSAEQIQIWNAFRKERVTALPISASNIAFGISNHLIALTKDNTLVIWGPDNVSQTVPIAHKPRFASPPVTTLLDGEGRRLLSWTEGWLKIWDVLEKKVVYTVKENVLTARLSPDGKQLAFLTTEGSLYIEDTQEREVIDLTAPNAGLAQYKTALAVPRDFPIFDFAFSGNGEHLVAALSPELYEQTTTPSFGIHWTLLQVDLKKLTTKKIGTADFLGQREGFEKLARSKDHTFIDLTSGFLSNSLLKLDKNMEVAATFEGYNGCGWLANSVGNNGVLHLPLGDDGRNHASILSFSGNDKPSEWKVSTQMDVICGVLSDASAFALVDRHGGIEVWNNNTATPILKISTHFITSFSASKNGVIFTALDAKGCVHLIVNRLPAQTTGNDLKTRSSELNVFAPRDVVNALFDRYFEVRDQLVSENCQTPDFSLVVRGSTMFGSCTGRDGKARTFYLNQTNFGFFSERCGQPNVLAALDGIVFGACEDNELREFLFSFDERAEVARVMGLSSLGIPIGDLKGSQYVLNAMPLDRGKLFIKRETRRPWLIDFDAATATKVDDDTSLGSFEGLDACSASLIHISFRGYGSRTIVGFDLEQKRPAWKLQSEKFSRRCGLIASIGDDASIAWLNDGRSGERLSEVPFGHRLQELELSPDKRFLAVGGHTGRIDVYEIASNLLVGSYEADPVEAGDLEWSQDGLTLFATHEGRRRPYRLFASESELLSSIQAIFETSPQGR